MHKFLGKNHPLYKKKKPKGKENPNFMKFKNPNNIAYSLLHRWLRTHHGKASKCENRDNNILQFECNKKTNQFEYAKKKNYKHEPNIENYYQLCKSCHIKYDYTGERKIKQRINSYKTGFHKYMKKLKKVEQQIIT